MIFNSMFYSMVQVTKDVVEEFADDNVKYLELRTTPRDVPATRMTKSSYIASVVAAINAAVSSEKDIIVWLLLALDRRMSLPDIEETLKLANLYASQSDSIVVGLDLSGNPLVCVLHRQRKLLCLAGHTVHFLILIENISSILSLVRIH